MSDRTLLVVVTGPPDAAVVGAALADRLGCAYVSLADIEDELAVDAHETPRAWLRYDAESEIVRRLTEFDGEAVLDVAVEPPLEVERVTALVRRWWANVVEVRCEGPGLRYDCPGRLPHGRARREPAPRRGRDRRRRPA